MRTVRGLRTLALLTIGLAISWHSTAEAQIGTVRANQKISDTEGGFLGVLNDNDYFGNAAAAIGDVDGNGVPDVAIGAYFDDDGGGENRGAVWLLFLNSDGTVSDIQKISDTDGNFTGVLDNGDNFGVSVVSPGDIDDDGVNDLVVGARLDDDGGTNRGALWVLFLNPDGTVKGHQKLSGTEGAGGNWNDHDQYGTSVAALGDLDGDGVEDIAAGGPTYWGGGTERGGLRVVFLNTDGTARETRVVSALDGGFTGSLDDGDRFGTSMASLGDLDGDGLPELAVGANWDDDGGPDRGAVYILFMNADGTVRTEQKISQTQGGFTGVLSDGGIFGYEVAALGDFDGDGVNDMAVGSPYDDDGGTRHGSVWILFLNTDGTVKAHQKISDTHGGFAGTLADMNAFGSAVAMLGDVDGDGTNDLAVGAMDDLDGGTRRGAAWVLFMVGPNAPPVAEAGADFSLRSLGGDLSVGLYGGFSSDVDGAIVRYTWSEDGVVLVEGDSATAMSPVLSMSPGVHQIGLEVEDDGGATDVDSVTVTIDFAVAQIGPANPNTMSRYNGPVGVSLYMDEATGGGVVSLEVSLCYDGDVLLPADPYATAGGATAQWAMESNLAQGVGTSIDTIKIASASDEALPAGGPLIDLWFTVADIRNPASSPLELCHSLLNDGTPTHTTIDGTVIVVGWDGVLSTFTTELQARDPIAVTLVDVDENRDPLVADQITVAVTNQTDTETVTLTETDVSTGEFAGVIGTVFSQTYNSGDGQIQAQAGDVIQVEYTDLLDGIGATTPRLVQVSVLGGTDGAVAISQVSQPGDKVYVRVSDADLNTDPSTAETATVIATSNTGESETITVTEVDVDTDIFFGSVLTAPGAAPGTDNDGTLVTAKGDILTGTYHDDLTEIGGEVDLGETHRVIDPFGDADGNGLVQAFDAAQALLHVLTGHLAGLELLAANVDELAPLGSGVDPYDAALILQKRVGLIGAFPVQEPTAQNHPQPETAANPKRSLDMRVLSLVPGDGYVAIWAEDRAGIVAGDVTLSGLIGRASLATDLGDFLIAQQQEGDGLRVVFAGAVPVTGPGELLRMGGPGPVRIEVAELNGGRLEILPGVSTLDRDSLPTAYSLHPNSPNPFNPETVIRFSLPLPGQVKLIVYDLLGRPVRTLVATQMAAGTHAVTWDGLDETGQLVGSGTYLYRIRAPGFTSTRRMTLLK